MCIHTAHVHKLLIVFLLLICLFVSLIYRAPANGAKMGGRKKDFSTLIKAKSDFMVLSTMDSFSIPSLTPLHQPEPTTEQATSSPSYFHLQFTTELCCCISYISLEPAPSLQLHRTKLICYPSPGQLAFPHAFLPNLSPSAA